MTDHPHEDRRKRSEPIIPNISAGKPQGSPEAWSDRTGDCPPMPRNYEKCRQCGENLIFRHHCHLMAEMTKLRGMIWWLASDLAADDENSTSETWVALAEKFWRQGLRSETRPINA